ncbi:hypothetical protein JHK87_016870 [Glycine soja]|nr:hypothetical protein JHK87_016870 [Glycine soja]
MPPNHRSKSANLGSSQVDALPPAIPPSSTQPQPFIPLLAPSPLIPFTNKSVPKLSGQSSKYSGVLALNITRSNHCFSDVQKVLVRWKP